MEPRFRYTENRKTLHSIPVGMTDLVEVVGDPDNAAYEWLVRTPDGVREHSDVAYGSPEVALRDGLIAYCGMPEPA